MKIAVNSPVLVCNQIKLQNKEEEKTIIFFCVSMINARDFKSLNCCELNYFEVFVFNSLMRSLFICFSVPH